MVKEQLQRLLEKYLLRRTKDNTIADQLPKKTDNIVFCRLAPLQMRAYKCAWLSMNTCWLFSWLLLLIEAPTSTVCLVT